MSSYFWFFLGIVLTISTLLTIKATSLSDSE
jgi:hypothetical protein